MHICGSYGKPIKTDFLQLKYKKKRKENVKTKKFIIYLLFLFGYDNRWGMYDNRWGM